MICLSACTKTRDEMRYVLAHRIFCEGGVGGDKKGKKKRRNDLERRLQDLEGTGQGRTNLTRNDFVLLPF